ncbi:MAG: hypothetical protein ABIK89_12150 [Planctomycetota bacterium]
MKAALSGILNRPMALGIRQVMLEVLVHPQKDPGVLLFAHDFLRPFAGKFEHAMVVFDREGCGREVEGRETLEADVEQRLATSGWADRARAIVIDPELENWVWSDSPEVDKALGWAGRSPALRPWLTEKGFFQKIESKPDRPKEAVEAALREVRVPRSSAIYRELAESVSFRRCSDPAFDKLTATLQRWFPPDEHIGKEDRP